MENISNFTVFLIVVAIFVSSFVGFVIARAVYSVEVDFSKSEVEEMDDLFDVLASFNESIGVWVSDEESEDIVFIPIMTYFDGVPYDFDGVPINTEVQP